MWTPPKMSLVLFSVLGNSCCKLMGGKTFWKGLAIPSFMHCQEVIMYSNAEIEKFQQIDNKAYRTILQLPKFTAVEFLRGEVGASSSKARDMKSKLMYLKHIFDPDGNELVRLIFEKEREDGRSKWIIKVEEYMREIGIDYKFIQDMKVNEIKGKINEWDTREWINGLNTKSTMKLHRRFKNEIREEKWFRNGYKWSIMMNARADTLKLRWREWMTSDGKVCTICRSSEETLEHFILDCQGLQEVREKYIELQRPMVEDREEVMANVLMYDKCSWTKKEYYVDMIYELWNERTKRIGSLV